MRNEQGHIDACLQSILGGDWPIDDLEILVVDGHSDDGSVECVRHLQSAWPQIVLLDNPDQTAPHAMNLGIKAARGEFVLRMDAHAIYDAGYITHSVQALIAHESEGVVGVGGVAHPVGMTYRSCAIGLAARSAFGAGDAHYRFSKRARFVDTIWNGCWRRETLIEIGGFNTAWVRNQDAELNYRLRQSGGRLLLDPAIRCRHFMRRSMARLARQYFQYGTWRVRTLCAHPGSLRWRQLAAPLFVAALTLALILGIGGHWLAASLLAGLYLSLATVFATRVSWPHDAGFIPGIVVAFAVMHLAWGSGFFNGLRRFGIPRLTRDHLRSSTDQINQPLD